MLLTVLGLLKGQSLSLAYATNLTVPEFFFEREITLSKEISLQNHVPIDLISSIVLEWSKEVIIMTNCMKASQIQ